MEVVAEVVPLAKRSEAPTTADTPRRFFLTGIIRPVSPYLQGKTCKRLGLRQLLQKFADRFIPTGIDLQD